MAVCVDQAKGECCECEGNQRVKRRLSTSQKPTTAAVLKRLFLALLRHLEVLVLGSDGSEVEEVDTSKLASAFTLEDNRSFGV
jgi:hypothetical protein